MTRPDCSYFIRMTGPAGDLIAADESLRTAHVVPDCLIGGVDGAVGEYEVKNGAMEQWADAFETFKNLSRDFPSLSVNIKENCEEPYTPPHAATYERGAVTAEGFGRLLDVDEYDCLTAKRCAAVLRAAGFNHAADYLDAHPIEQW